MIENKEYIEAEDKNLIKFIISVLEGRENYKKFETISVHISERLAKAIENIVGFSVFDYGNEIDSGQIQHIWKEHGRNGKTDKSMADVRNLARIAYVVDNFDNIRPGKNRSKYKNSDGTLAKTVEIQKKIGEDFYYVVEAIPDTRLRKLRVVSAYINKNDTFSEVAVLNNSPSRYVQNEPQPNASSSNIIIPNDD